MWEPRHVTTICSRHAAFLHPCSKRNDCASLSRVCRRHAFPFKLQAGELYWVQLKAILGHIVGSSALLVSLQAPATTFPCFLLAIRPSRGSHFLAIFPSFYCCLFREIRGQGGERSAEALYHDSGPSGNSQTRAATTRSFNNTCPAVVRIRARWPEILYQLGLAPPCWDDDGKNTGITVGLRLFSSTLLSLFQSFSET